ncbi:DUF6497 family protein [Cognatishimia sp. F0-27]|uniref:DUF6497 family protein n=1 Tax=Cognatishimia sp. F0-27 TaxID=2816855 RepID=UPI001D0C7B3E|nr:DUF6497 family protein [Cognatishimia sp. F0-27]
MRCLGLGAAFAVLAGAAGADDRFAVPSGVMLAFHDIVSAPDDGLATVRFRFLAPDIAGIDPDPEVIVADMEYLCAKFAKSFVTDAGGPPQEVVITLMSEPTEFGVANPGVTQFFERFRLEDNVCIWEAF